MTNKKSSISYEFFSLPIAVGFGSVAFLVFLFIPHWVSTNSIYTDIVSVISSFGFVPGFLISDANQYIGSENPISTFGILRICSIFLVSLGLVAYFVMTLAKVLGFTLGFVFNFLKIKTGRYSYLIVLVFYLLLGFFVPYIIWLQSWPNHFIAAGLAVFCGVSATGEFSRVLGVVSENGI
jgi:hypothetical protein